MSLEYIRNHYDVPANRGQRVVFLGAQEERRPGCIVGACVNTLTHATGA